MADEAEDVLDLDLEQDETPENQDIDADPPELEGDEAAEDDGDDVEVIIGDEPAPEAEKSGTDLVRHLREVNREQARELANLRRATPVEEAPKPIEVGPLPTIEEHDYDADKHAAAVEAWAARKAEAAAQAADAEKVQEASKAASVAVFNDFNTKKTAMRARDFDVAEGVLVASLSPIQVKSILEACDNSANVVYALGKHPKKLAELKAITNPVKFIAAVVKLEGTIKVTPRRQAPDVDTSVRGSASLAPKVDKHLEGLENAAEKNGDRSKVIAYKRSLKEKARK